MLNIKRLCLTSMAAVMLVALLGVGFMMTRVDAAISTVYPSATSARPINPPISDDRAVEIARDYVGLSPGEPGGRINFTMSYEYEIWVWRFWLSGNNGGLFHIDVETGEVLLFDPDAPVTFGSVIRIGEGVNERSNDGILNWLSELIHRIAFMLPDDL